MNHDEKSFSFPYIRNLPLYRQHPNGCGLASLLMLINPEKDKEIREFLTTAWKKIQPLFGDVDFKSPELEWAIVLQYILLKVQAYADKEKLYEFFNSRLDNYAFEDYRIVNQFNQENYRNQLLERKRENEAYTYLPYLEGRGHITPIIIFKNLHTMKTDAELKILAEIFNYRFLYQPSEDRVGALYFTRKELKSRRIAKGSVREKWKTLEDFANNPDIIILYGRYHHWLAVRGIYRTWQLTLSRVAKEESEKEKEGKGHEKDDAHKIQTPPITQEEPLTEKEKWDTRHMILAINDPATVSAVELSFNHLSESDRFYIFEKRKDEKEYVIFKELLSTIESDINEEIKLYKDYLRKRKEERERKQRLKNKNKDKEKDKEKEKREHPSDSIEKERKQDPPKLKEKNENNKN